MLLAVSDFCCSIKGIKILEQISFSIQKGEFVSLIGPNGAGKSTLLKCINRINSKNSGQITLMGRPLQSYSQRELAKFISYVPQSGGRRLPFSVREFIHMSRYAHSSFSFRGHSEKDEQIVSEAMTTAKVDIFSDRKIETLSGGEAQRVLIAAALASEGTLMLLDEPTSFLDPAHQDDIHQLLAEVNQKTGCAILNVSHDINQAAMISDRIIALKNGRIAFDGPAKDILCNACLEVIFDKTFTFASHPITGLPVIVPNSLSVAKST